MLRPRCLSTVAAIITLATGAVPAFATHPRAAHSDAAADAAVAKLRELPLPMRRLPQGISSTNATPPPLPDLEARRQQVYDELHALGPASVPALARALRDPDPEMRRDVAVALDVVGGGWWHFPDGAPKLDLRPALPALLAALQDPDPGVRAWVAQDISDIGSGAATAVSRLRSMLHSPDAESRGTACNALGAIGSAARAALPDLRRALSDTSPEVRQSARAAIARIDRAAARP
ncbi:MAG: HEAT repeat domain-containing protein [Steroidobacteraceae bacterium]